LKSCSRANRSSSGWARESSGAKNAQLERVGVVGLRLGATFAALFCEEVVARSEYEQLRTGPLVLWDPLMDGESYFQELLRSNLTTQLAVYGEVREDREALRERIRAGGAVNVDGYELGNALFESCATRALLSTESKRHAGPVLVVQIATTDQSKDRTDLQALAQSYSRGTFLRSKEQTFWREIKPFYGRAHDLQKTTLAWMDKHRV